MLNRCQWQKSKSFKDYGGRGITVCDRWQAFANFLEDMGHGPEGMEIDRIDNDLGYFKANCRWVTALEQGRNRRNVHRVTFQGITKTLGEWSDVTGLKYHTIYERLQKGWAVEKALTCPVSRTI